MTTNTVMPATQEATFRAIGTTIHLLATERGVITEAERVARRRLEALDAAASRFRPDSEVSRLAARAAHAEASTFVSPVFAAYLAAALHAARITDGLVDPTVGRALEATGYDTDIEQVRRRYRDAEAVVADPCVVADPWAAPRVPGWESVRFDETTRHLTVAAGTLLDLGSSAKGHAADLIAAELAAALPGGFAVNLGGDIATSGSQPPGGWPIGVEDAHGRVVQTVLGTGQAFATSSTRLRRWSARGQDRHHIVDPRTGSTAGSAWAQVTCAGATALEANAASTAAVVLGEHAPEWLAVRRIPARLVSLDGGTTTTPGWPEGRRGAA